MVPGHDQGIIKAPFFFHKYPVHHISGDERVSPYVLTNDVTIP